MQQVSNVNYENLPKIGYYASAKNKKEKIYKTEAHIPKQGPLTDLKVGAHKLYNDIFTYYPKGFRGSKNSNFYEYLSLGMVPYIVGSCMLIGLYGLATGKYNSFDKDKALKFAKRSGAGVVLYGIGKWLSKKVAHTGIHASTGINLDWKLLNKINEFPENGQEEGFVRIQYPGVFDSADFPRKDKTALWGELEHGNIYAYEDKILEKAGYKTKQNAPNQTAWPLIREVKVRTTALENISKYVVAATGVALGFQKAFENIKLKDPSSILKALKDGIKQLWNGKDRSFITKHYGKALLGASVIATLLTWLIPTHYFKSKPDTMKAKVDTKKEFEVA